jgi:hypothetical protein
MKFMKLTFGIAALALGVASAASSYSVKIYDTLTIGGNQFKPGDYKVEMKDNKVTFKMGKSVVEVPATFATNDRKYESTTFVSENSKVIELDLGGTTTKVMFNGSAVPQNPSGSK